LVNEGFFPKGTTYRSIVVHELGHRYGDLHEIDCLTIGKEVGGFDSNIQLFQFLKENISIYSSSFSDGSEIISECFSIVFSGTEKNKFALKFVKKCSTII
jgi:hypothetical protein